MSVTTNSFFVGSGLSNPRGTATFTTTVGLVTTTYIYVVNNNANTVTRYKLNSDNTVTEPTLLISTGLNRPSGIAIFTTVDGTYIYVTNSASNTVTKYDLTGTRTDFSVVIPAITDGLNDPQGIAIFTTPIGTEAEQTYIYVTNFNNTVTKYDLTGTRTNFSLGIPAISDGLDFPIGIVVDSSFIYVVNSNSSKVTLYNLDGSTNNLTFITAELSIPQGIAIFTTQSDAEASQTYIYVTDANNSTVTKYDLTGSPVGTQPFISGLSSPYGIAIDPSFIYVVNNGNNTTVGKYNLFDGTTVNSTLISNEGLNYPEGIAIDGTYIYVTNTISNTVTKYDLTGTQVLNNGQAFISSGLNTPVGIAVGGNYIYVTNRSNGNVGQYNLANGTTVNATLISSGLSNPTGIAIDATYIYVTNSLFGSNSTFNRYLLDGTEATTLISSGLSNPTGIAIDATYIYVTNNSNNTVNRYLLDGTPDGTPFISGLNSPIGIALDGTYIYVSNAGNRTVNRYLLDGTLVSPTPFISGLSNPQGIAVNANNFYVANYRSSTVSLSIDEATCFLEGSKILTKNGYEKIENLKKGDLIETYQHGLKEICLIGKREIYHSANKERINNQLYKYEKEELIITGGHSILVDELKEEEAILNKIYFGGVLPKIDGKHRLLACVDENASVYKKEGKYFIYHLALESEDEDQAYGIYANGMLVESCAIKYLKEVSGMELV